MFGVQQNQDSSFISGPNGGKGKEISDASKEVESVCLSRDPSGSMAEVSQSQSLPCLGRLTPCARSWEEARV